MIISKLDKFLQFSGLLSTTGCCLRSVFAADDEKGPSQLVVAIAIRALGCLFDNSL